MPAAAVLPPGVDYYIASGDEPVFAQAVKRANRYGSTEPLEVYIPITEIERPMVDTVLRKARMFDQDTKEQERMFKEFGYDFAA